MEYDLTKIPELPLEQIEGLTGDEDVAIDQNGVTKRTKLSNLLNSDNNFTDLNDTPESYADSAEKVVSVKSGQDGLEFSDVQEYELVTGTTVEDNTKIPTKAYVDDITGGGAGVGGHEYKENDVAIIQRSARNLKTNGSKTVLVDDAANGETEESVYFEVALDVDPTGANAGDLWGKNATNDKTEPQATLPYEGLYNGTPEANLNADGQLSMIIPAGYKIENITISETAGNAAGNISIGSTALGTDIVNALTVGANADLLATLGTQYFSRVNDTDLYISSSAWGTGVVTIYVTFIQV